MFKLRQRKINVVKIFPHASYFTTLDVLCLQMYVPLPISFYNYEQIKHLNVTAICCYAS